MIFWYYRYTYEKMEFFLEAGNISLNLGSKLVYLIKLDMEMHL